MKKIVGLFFIIFSAGSAFSQDSIWYQAFTGRIDRYPITLHLQKSAESHSGFYYYHNSKLPIELVELIGYENLRLSGYSLLTIDSEVEPEIFSLQLKGDSLNGTWQLNESSRKLEVKLARMEATPFVFQNWTTSGVFKLKPELEESAGAAYDGNILWPVGKQSYIPALQKAINKLVNEVAEIRSPLQYLETQRDLYLEDYRKELREVADSDWMEYPSSYSYSLAQNMNLVYFSDKWVSLESFWHSYSGGAHGNYGSAYLCFDFSRQRALELKDILTPAGFTVLPTLMAQSLRKQLGLKANEPLTEGGLFEDEVPVTENFYLTDTGICFSYTPYEIGPYAMGEIRIFLTFQQLKAYLQAGWPGK